VTPFNTYLKIGGALFLLTFLTIGAHALREYFHPFSAIIAFSIAGVKAYLVMAWFMHLKYDVPSNRIIFASGFIFLGLLFIICTLDIFTRVFQGSVL
jgi:cytochrome c oxidase subunit 4